jgi:hypothetical protein
MAASRQPLRLCSYGSRTGSINNTGRARCLIHLVAERNFHVYQESIDRGLIHVACGFDMGLKALQALQSS